MTDLCVLCEETFVEGECVVVKDRGIKTLIECSKKRGDGKNILFQGRDTVKLHVSCRKSYTREKCVAAAMKARETQSREKRSSAPIFVFKEKCLFCAEDASENFVCQQTKKPSGKREVVSLVSTMNFKNHILEVAQGRGDKWGEDVSSRIRYVSDLVASDGRYHQSCMKKFLVPVRTKETAGRPQNENVTAAFEHICNHIESNKEECQFSMREILSNFQGNIPSEKILKKRLLDKYGNDVIISTGKNRQPVICFKNTGYNILTKQWYESQKKDEDEERLRIIRAAGDIIREDIRSKVYTIDTYPDPLNFLEDCADDIPQSLKCLLDVIIVKGKRGNEHKLETKVTSIAHSIISATRPRSFISSLQVGFGALISRKYGSRELIQIAHVLGFSCSYDEVRMFEVSCLNHPQSTVHPHTFSQFVFDNADVNVETIDGSNTFHAMGGIQCITPATSNSSGGAISRVGVVPKASAVGKFGAIPLVTFEKFKSSFADIIIEDLREQSSSIELLPSDFTWIFGKWKGAIIPGWNGFMEEKTASRPFSKSQTLYLPFINAPASSYSTIYTALLTAARKCKSMKQDICCVTFDQPLYFKAREIISSSPADHELSTVVVRLGGFHLLMSFLGAIGYIMDGSGLQDAFSIVYAQASTEKMLAGHAYSRAVRAHTLCNLALGHILLTRMEISEEETTALLRVLDSTSLDCDYETNPTLASIYQKFKNTLEEVEKGGATAKLWVQYFNLTTLMKQFIHAERSGNWELHLSCIKKMLPYFHASGHFLYAKSAHIYLQDMLALKGKLAPTDYEKFVVNGWFSIRRSDKFWSGVWTDMTIEQTLMRSLKSSGGLSHGRGISDSTLTKWILTMPIVTTVSQQIEDLCGLSFRTCEQHTDARDSRIIRDNKDVHKLVDWFKSHDPFTVSEFVISISTGILGDETINCHKAFEIGNSSMNSIVGTNFEQVKFVRKNRVMPIRGLQSKIKISNEEIVVNPDTLFRRIAMLKKSDKELMEYFEYELAPYPLSLFDETGMRKTPKSVFYDFFTPVTDNVNFHGVAYVIDGGFLLHRVVWKIHEPFSEIVDSYVAYIKKYYFQGITYVVFDGYPEDLQVKSTKSAERLRRAKRCTAPEVLFTESMTATMSQENFLSNSRNKGRLITMLKEKLESEGIFVKQAKEDADHLIVTTAIEAEQEHDCVVLVGEDTDLLIMLTAIASQSANIFFLKPGKGNIPNHLFSVSSFTHSKCVKNCLLFLHAFSGCDTTSALYRQGKKKFVKLMVQNPELLEVAEVFMSKDAHPDSLLDAGQKFLVALYGGKSGETLNVLRFQLFAKSLLKTNFNLASLPPTPEAAHQHCLRTYLQVQTWLGYELNPLSWGWKNTKIGVAPVTTQKQPAPQSLLMTIICKCTKGCNTSCSCRKAGIKCSTICVNCRGHSCTNTPSEDQVQETTEEYDTYTEEILHLSENEDDLDAEEEQPTLPQKRQRCN